ncbi:MAG: hypothetical protein WC683_17280, partial [bacterium]
MPRNASGIYTQPSNTQAVQGNIISPDAYNSLITDIGTELTNSLDRQGRSAMGANLPMGGFKVVNAAEPTSAQDVATKNYIDTTVAPINATIAGLQSTLVFLRPENNLSDVSNVATARTNLGLGTMATQNNVVAANLPSGSTILLNTFAANNSATVSDTTSFTAAYTDYEIVVSNLVPGTGGVDLGFQVHSGGSFANTLYEYSQIAVSVVGSAVSGNASGPNISLSQPGGVTVSALPGWNARIHITEPTQTFGPKVISWELTMPSTSGGMHTVRGGGWWYGGAGAVTGFQL